MYLLQKIEIPGNTANPGNDEYIRKKIELLFIFDFVPTNLHENQVQFILQGLQSQFLDEYQFRILLP